MFLKQHANDLVVAAMKRVVTISIDDAQRKRLEPNVLLVDIREAHELERDGTIPNAINVPRGVLEFRIDPSSPYCCDEFLSAREIILYCQAGSRSALAAATLQDMGVSPVCHIEGGFAAWKRSGAEVTESTDCPVLPMEK
ncbi:rhodanese-like domain-containing protein [Bremerella sp. JC770]|uniref:rhodanese-like domain-containing protein n=1 Tax=Bremerella sp. JC770 TaxID=3232137 RepID=UPI003457C3E6